MVALRYQDGTLVVSGLPADAFADALPEAARADFRWDDRVGAARGPAFHYAALVRSLHAEGRPFDDGARAWERLPLRPRAAREPRAYQREAVAAWTAAGGRGAVVLPTGAGKTFVAELCIAAVGRPALIVAPTLDLVAQWHTRLSAAFGVDVGLIGGGEHRLGPLTVSTYDSAALHLGRYGDRFGLIVWDEAHHLPAPAALAAARGCLAPYQLGLTATWERPDGREALLDELLGGVVYRRGIPELAGEFLAPYDSVQLRVTLGPDERERYTRARATFRDFCASHGVRLGGPQGWGAFLRAAARSAEGRAAHRAYREYRGIAHGTEQKLDLLCGILASEKGRRALIFAHDNATAYRVSRELLVPCITHRTDVKERQALLAAFSDGSLPVLATSQVLNEGVDLPEAEVAIVLSGTGTVREHVQRLGRVLRPGHGKRAVLYELVAADTTEEHTSARRRDHEAWKG